MTERNTRPNRIKYQLHCPTRTPVGLSFCLFPLCCSTGMEYGGPGRDLSEDSAFREAKKLATITQGVSQDRAAADRGGRVGVGLGISVQEGQ